MVLSRINSDLIAALKEGNKIRAAALRFLLSAIKNKEIELKKPQGLTDEEVISVIKKQVKSHAESIEAFSKGGRSDLVEKEKKELEFLKSYLPEEMTEEEIREVVSAEVERLRRSGTEPNFGEVMKTSMGVLKGKADGAIVSRIVREVLTPQA